MNNKLSLILILLIVLDIFYKYSWISGTICFFNILYTIITIFVFLTYIIICNSSFREQVEMLIWRFGKERRENTIEVLEKTNTNMSKMISYSQFGVVVFLSILTDRWYTAYLWTTLFIFTLLILEEIKEMYGIKK